MSTTARRNAGTMMRRTHGSAGIARSGGTPRVYNAGVYAATQPRHTRGVTTSSDDLRARAEQWAKDDPDPKTQAEVRALLVHATAADGAESPQHRDLADRFAGALEFGTAGLRGVIGAGPNRMNRAVVARTTWGLAQHLIASLKSFVPNLTQTIMLPGCGHWTQQERAAEVSAAMKDFLSDL